jgi:ABC-2 type transport system permease protein
MTRIFLIAADEWRYWWRSQLAIAVLVIAFLLTCVSAYLTVVRMDGANHERTHLQETAEDAFLTQPDKHPHRMVHYGHYVFRPSPPLGMIDPGVDAFTGTSIFLEGHRQNSAMFAEERATSGLTVFGALTPAFVLQVFAPLLLILIGYASLTREREASTLRQLVTQGVSPATIVLGKGMALAGVAVLMVAPLLATALIALKEGEGLSLVLLFLCVYFVYFLIWAGLIVLVSGVARTGGTSLGLLLILWIMMAVLLPRVASSTASAVMPVPSKLETDFAVTEELRKIGDGHNANDPAFIKLKASFLEQYGVEKVEDLPVNFKGVVAGASEAQLTGILTRFAEERMRLEMRQAEVSRIFGWLSPVLALRETSMIVAGTDLATHHRFLREAEDVRFDFVQGLNKVQAEKVTFADDSRTRVGAENWQVLNDFEFAPAPSKERLSLALPGLIKLLIWFCGIWIAGAWCAQRMGRP